MIGLLSWPGPAITLGQHCPLMTQDPERQFQFSKAQTVQTTIQTGVYKSSLFFHVGDFGKWLGGGGPTGALAVPIAVMYPHLKASFTYKRPRWEDCSLSLKYGMWVGVELGSIWSSVTHLGSQAVLGWEYVKVLF